MADPTIQTVAEACDKLTRSFEAFKEANDKRLAEITAKGQPSAETLSKIEKIEKEMNFIEDAKKRLEKLELAKGRQRVHGDRMKDVSDEEHEHLQAFDAYLRNPKDGAVQSRLSAASKAASVKMQGVDTTGNTQGGYAVPTVIDTTISELLLDISDIRGIARVETIGTPSYKELVDVLGQSSGWVGETASRTATNTPDLQSVTPTIGTLYAYPKASEEAMNDIFFDVPGWLQRRTVQEFAYQEGLAHISGDGTNKPTGFMAGAKSSIGDTDSPHRAFGTLQYVPTGKAGAFPNDQTGSPPGNPGDVLLNCMYALKKGYRRNARWAMNKATLNTLRQFKDAQGRYLWVPGLTAGQDGMLLGYPVQEAEGMPDIAANTLPIAFGDFKEAYLIVDLVGLRVTVDDNITTPGYVKFYVRKRTGGKLIKDEALKLIKCAAS
jgi:HK97 family phage major capsid protein